VRGFDTNVLVRFLVRDDPRQAKIVANLISEAAETGSAIYVNAIVLCETVWVLESGYGYLREEIADAVERLLHTQQFEFQERDLVWRSLRRYGDGRADFADYLIGEKNQADDCDQTVTFDRALKGEQGFEFLT
jgi:predicted nucleic-acid-binding protein